MLPPNLLKLFAPRPPLPYSRPVDKDVDRVTKKNVDGVAGLLERLKEESLKEKEEEGKKDDMEEGEEPTFTHAEEVKRQILREERKRKKAEEFKVAKDTCLYLHSFARPRSADLIPIDKPQDDPEAVGDPYKTLFIARLVRPLSNPEPLDADLSIAQVGHRKRPPPGV